MFDKMLLKSEIGTTSLALISFVMQVRSKENNHTSHLTLTMSNKTLCNIIGIDIEEADIWSDVLETSNKNIRNCRIEIYDMDENKIAFSFMPPKKETDHVT